MFELPDDDLDAALGRLEDVLLGLPYDRALPDVATLLDAAGITSAHLTADDRMLKVMHEAIVARPLATSDEIATLRTSVELLTLEVGVLGERLADPATSTADVQRMTERLGAVRAELDRIRRQL
ncbi:MAG: hypothetical protein KY457_02520 [Actinobacteria bacterium]|nr:hypothetical protein [Actinomycetota bacterium]